MDKVSILTNRRFYPECYIPERLLNYFEGNIKELIEKKRPTFTEQEPKPPKPPDKPHFSETIKALLIASFIGLFFNFTTFITIIFILLIVASFHYIIAKNAYPKLVKNYDLELSSYKSSIKNYHQNVEIFKNKLEKYNSDLNSYRFINSMIVSELQETFRNSPKPSVSAQSPKKGKSELAFKEYLVKYFGDAIHYDCTIEIFNYSKKIDSEFNYSKYDDDNYIDVTNYYVPDFCFIHPTKSLKIDIEIDEPYTFKKPIHYFGSETRRNQYFVEKNWMVVRFSEQQVIKAPNECCREIGEIIHDFTNDASYINKLLNVKRPTRLKKWTLDDANSHITTNHRQYYPELEIFSVNVDLINAMWEAEEITYEFVGTSVKKVTKKKNVVEKAWKNYSGIFYLNKTHLNRYCINILWDTNLTEYLIIDTLTKNCLTITNMHTRAIYSLTSRSSCENSPFSIYHDDSSKITFSIDKIKEEFGCEQIAFERIYNKEEKTEYSYYSDEKKKLILIMHQNLIKKLNNDRSYNKIGIGKPQFFKLNENNRIKIELVDKDEGNFK